MLLKGLVDSPPDQSETLWHLEAIERRLHVCRDGSDWEVALSADHDQILRDLWELLLDVVCSPLWLRIRAAELLNVCFTLRQDYLRVDAPNAHWIRSIVSSTCQILDELDPRHKEDATNLFHWLAFLDHLLSATADSRVFARAFRHSTYASMLSKMVRLLGLCSTRVFAATTVCLAAFHDHERRLARETADASTSVLLDTVLSETTREGNQHVGGALLHVINSCGCPCPESRLAQLHKVLQLLLDILRHPQVFRVVFVNDFKVLVDIVLRECTDLPLDDALRLEYLRLLDVVIASPLYLDAHFYRKAELLKLLEDLLTAGTIEDAGVPMEVTQCAKDILLERIDRLD
ncbi:hypothetical protein ATCC90586_004403 [Pythium insidiosum]|nr:hypothetical protein ATCC90586_004403 [Pythium insidiosum]